MAAADGIAARACPDAWARLSREERRRHVQRVGNDLVRHHGKRNYYSIHQVREANRRQKVDIDLVCWSHAFFNSHADFDRYHIELGEACDYTAMKAEMLASVSGDSVASWFDVDLDLSWLEFPDIDWSIFDFLDL
jgi:hypothetical protein